MTPCKLQHGQWRKKELRKRIGPGTGVLHSRLVPPVRSPLLHIGEYRWSLPLARTAVTPADLPAVPLPEPAEAGTI